MTIRILELAVLHMPERTVTVAHELTQWSDQTHVQVRAHGVQVGIVIQPVSDAGTLKRTWP